MTVQMQIAPANVNSFKSIFNAINTIVDTLTFECYNDRVEVNALDKSKTVFMSLVMSTDYFDSYSCADPDRFNIDVTEFRKIIKSCNAELGLDFDSEKVVIKSTTKTFTIYQVNDDLDTPKPPSLDYSTKFEVPVKYLKSMIKDIELFAKDVTITARDNAVSFSTEGTSGKFEDTYALGDNISPATVRIATEKFATCISSDKVSDDIELQFDTDMPLILVQENEGIRLMYLIAPRIDVSD